MTPTEKLQDKLAELGFIVTDWHPTTGYWRSQDVNRWEAHGIYQGYNKAHIESCYTVTECLKWGPIELASCKDPLKLYHWYTISLPNSIGKDHKR